MKGLSLKEMTVTQFDCQYKTVQSHPYVFFHVSPLEG